MKHNGKTIHFLLDREWLNYRYKMLDRCKAESVLHLSKIVDAICPSAGQTVILLDTMVLGRSGTDWLFLIESEYDEKERRVSTSYKLANVFDDRLPQHPFIYTEDVVNGHTGNPIRDRLRKQLLDAGEEDE